MSSSVRGAKEADQCRHHSLPAQRSIQDVAEQLRTLDDELTVNLPHRIANGRHERRGIARGADVQRHTRLVVLGEQKVDRWRRVVLQGADVDRIRDDANDDLRLIGLVPHSLT